MKNKTTLRNKVSVKTKLTRRLVIIVSSSLLLAIVGISVVLNLQSKDSKANLYDDGVFVTDLLLTSMCSDDPASMRRWRVRNSNDFPVPYEWDVYPYVQTGILIAQPGDNFFYTNTIGGPNTTRIRWQDENLEWKQTTKASGGQQCAPSGCFASEVYSYNPTKRKDGSTIPDERRNPSKALGAPQNSDELNFVALGFGGEIVLKFAQPIANGAGNDIRVIETTYGSPRCDRYPERVQAFASQDGCNFVYLGEGCQDAEFDLGVLSWAQFIMLKDVSPINASFNNDGQADGYDVDAIQCLNGSATSTDDDGLVAGSASEVVQYVQGTRKNGTAIHHTRTNPDQALGVPQNNDIGVNFVTLGFEGKITLKFDYVVFDKPGNDLMIVETSFGAPSCDAYPERALVEVSLDGITWHFLDDICLDKEIDLNGIHAIQFIRITDRSAQSQFSNSADGFDLDGVLVLNGACETNNTARIAYYDNNNTPDEIAEIIASPNPFRDQFSLTYATGAVDEDVKLRVFNYVGQEVMQDRFKVARNTKIEHPISLSQLPKGVYIITTESGGQKQSVKVIKN